MKTTKETKASAIDNSQNSTLKEAFTDSLGNKWYCHLNILELSPSRGVAAARADRFVGLKISQNNMEALLDSAIDGINKPMPDLVNAIAVLHQLKRRTVFLTEESSLLDLAGIYYFLQDEDPRFISGYHDIKKRDIWEKDPACKGFFLHIALALTKQFSDTPEADLLSFLEKTQSQAQEIYDFIPRT
jgi:hypothetical protein